MKSDVVLSSKLNRVQLFLLEVFYYAPFRGLEAKLYPHHYSEDSFVRRNDMGSR